MTPFAYRLDWGTTPFDRANDNLATATVAAPVGSGAGQIGVTFTSVPTGAVTRAPANLTVPATLNVGGLGAAERCMRIEHLTPVTAGRANRQTITVTFDRAVTDLEFTITDVDSSNSASKNKPRSGWWDQVELTGTRTAVLAAPLTGTGVPTAPWKYATDKTNVAADSPAGNVAVTYAGPLTTFTLDYWSDSSDGNQAITLGDFTFTATGC